MGERVTTVSGGWVPRAALIAAFLAAVSGAEVQASRARAAGEPLIVYAGAGFRLPVERAARLFAEREGIPVEATYAGSGCLLAQAELAGRGDVFLPGEIHYAEQARARGLAGDLIPVAWLRPVIALRRGDRHSVERLEDLARPGLRLGLGDPRSVAVGVAAEAWLEDALDEKTAAAVRANVTTRAINVNELGTQLALGAIDAAIVWDATVPLYDGLRSVAPESGRRHRTRITGTVLSMSARPDAAARFLELLAGADGAAIFRSLGYEPWSAAGETP